MPDYMRSRHRDEGDGFFCRFTFGQFFALLILEVFTIFFVFYLGAKYGREFLGLDNVISQTESSTPKVLTTSDAKGKQVARELMAKAKTPELRERIRRMIEGNDKNINSNGAQNLNASDSTSSQSSVLQEAKPSIVEPPASVKEGEPPTSNAGTGVESSDSGEGVVKIKSASNAKYSVQVGSYPTMKEATRIVDKWRSKGYPAYMMIADIPDKGRWYRVRMGGFQSRNEASHYLARLKSSENIDAIIVLNEH